jgi:DNA-binding HxlR family transcriptional regulator
MRKLASSNFRNEQRLLNDCPFNFTISFIGGRWKPALLWKIHEGHTRFTELKKVIAFISDKVLSDELAELESTGLLSRKVFAEVPLRVEYALTQTGESLLPILDAMQRWAIERNQSLDSQSVIGSTVK